MSGMPIPVFDGSQCSPYRNVRPTANSTDNNSGNFASRAPTTTAPNPATDGIIKLGGSVAPTRMKFVPYGVGTSTNTFLMRVLGWDEINGLWVPTLLWQGTCTINSASPGVAGNGIDATNYFCDTIVTSKGTDGVECQPFSPANGAVGHLILDVKGSQFLEVQFDRNGSATSANSLVKNL